MNVVLKNDALLYLLTGVLSFIAYYYGIKLMVASDILKVVVIVCAVLFFGYNTYNYKLVASIVPNYRVQYIVNVLLTFATITVALILPQFALAYSVLASFVLPFVTYKLGIYDSLRDIYC